MVSNNQSFTIKLVSEDIRKIEQFVDMVCDQLFINDTYYGSVLTAMTELFGVLVKSQKSTDEIKVDYQTDHKSLTIGITPIEEHIMLDFADKVSIENLSESEVPTSIFLIKSLVDKWELVGDAKIDLSFDISALHKQIYQQRAKELNLYFNISQPEKVKKENDQL